MPAQITTAFRNQYKDEILASTQQRQTVLEGAVRFESLAGEQTFWDTISEVSVQEVQSRLEENVPVETPRGRRAISTKDYKYVEHFEPRDFPRMMRGVEPGGYIIENVASSFARKKDDIILAAIDGTAYTGKDGTTGLSFSQDGGSDIVTDFESSGTDTGLSIEKLREARRLLESNNVAVDGQIWLLVHPTQKWQLLASDKSTSQDFIVDHPYVDAKISHFLGCNVLLSTRIGTHDAATSGSNNAHYAYMFTTDSMLFGMNKSMETHVDELVTKGHGVQLAVYANMAATRLYGDRIVRISCEDTWTP